MSLFRTRNASVTTVARAGLAAAAICASGMFGAQAYAADNAMSVAAPDRACASFKDRFAFASTVVTSTEYVAAGSFTPPGAAAALTRMPAFCRVLAKVSVVPGSKLGVEIWLPANWNGKFESIGTHGFGGTLYYEDMAVQLRRGYAISSSDIGHVGRAGEFFIDWAYGHPQQIIDYAWRGTHTQTAVSKAAIKEFYGQGPRYSYFNGCSKGGSQGLQLAQMFPHDYDGIISGGAVSEFTHATASQLWIGHNSFGNGGIGADPRYIDPKKYPIITRAVLKACDGLDGVVDGILTDPRKCAWKPEELLCKAGQDAGQCLTAAQVDSLKAAYAPLRNPVSHQVIYRGISKSGENANFRASAAGPEPVGFGLYFYKAFVFEDPKWDWTTMDYDQSVRQAETVNDTYHFDVTADMSEFRKSGAKLIEYEGWLDNNFPPESFIDRYEQVGAVSRGVHQDYHRLFMAPGMMHCGGGDGPTAFGGAGIKTPPPVIDADHDLVSALEKWVEQGVAPEKIIATKYVDGDPAKGIAMQRPLCPYPQAAQYKGTGNPNDASNFTCVVDDRKGG